MGDDDHKLSTGRLARLAKLASMSAKLSTDVVTRGVKRIASKEGAESLLGGGAAEKLVATLGELKGLAMKIGQQVSMAPDLLSPEVRAVVARLQNQAPPMPWAQVHEVLKAQLGRPPEEAYAAFEETPLASASLGQVHKAVTKDGTPVAVKVQYPDIARALQADLDNLGTMVGVLATTTRLTQGKAYFSELRESMMDELDYRQEAARAHQFALAASGVPDIRVPRVFEELTSEKVLTLELFHGPTLKDLLHHSAQLTNEERFRVSRLLIRAIWGPFLQRGLIHSDPHPGNFILRADQTIGVLDFGAVKQLSPAWVDVNRRLFRHTMRDEPWDHLRLSQACGFEFDDPEAARDFVAQVVELATRPPRSRELDFATAGITRDLRTLFLKNAPRLASIRPPKESLLFFRAVGGLTQNLENLGARGNFRRIYEELLALVP
jgi:predicted unusual protein kinase regulating ubiquinone biosynthesis (AarF/ABC1/UbiB family)